MVSQLFKNTSVYITGPIINTALILCAVYCGTGCGIILGIITPVTSFFITGSPVMSAVPALFPCIMLGNILLVLSVCLLRDRFGTKAGLPVSIVIGALTKAAAMGLLISVILLPNLLPEAMLPKLSVLQLQFSLVQLVTALIGGVYAVIINAALKKARIS